MKSKLIIISDEDFSKEYRLHSWEEVDYRFIVFSNINDTQCTVKFFLDNPDCKAQVSILWIIHNQKKIHIDGQIIIGSNGSNTSWHLSEEVLIIGNHSYTFTKPVLDVANNAVSASHGAKIHRIPKSQLFYLMSRGLSEWEAKKTIITGLIEKMFEWEYELDCRWNTSIKWNKDMIIQRIHEITLSH